MAEKRLSTVRTDNAFYEFLDSLGLPHAKLVRELRVLFGVTQSKYYPWAEIQISDAKTNVKPIVPSQVGYFHFNDDPQASDLLPPGLFHAFSSIGNDARENHRATLESLESRLGKAGPGTQATNTISHRWTFEHATLDIMTWPPELNTQFSNESLRKFPELAAFTHISISPAHLPEISEQELNWIEGYTPIKLSAGNKCTALATERAEVYAGVFRWVQSAKRESELGLSSDGKALVARSRELAMILEVDQIESLRLLRLLPARGSGQSSLNVRYRDRFSSTNVSRDLYLLLGPKTESLDKVANELAQKLSLTLKVDEYNDD